MHWNIENYYHHLSLPFWGFMAFGSLLALVIIWSLVWKGMALWKAAQRKDLVWFIVFLFVNTAGILEILYLYFFSKKNSDGK